MKISIKQAVEKNNGKTCRVIEYKFPYKDLGMDLAFINGRYPEKGSNVNLECDEIYFIKSGSGFINLDNSRFELLENDMFYIVKGKPYFVEGNNLEIVLSTSPAWFLEQSKNIK